MESINNNNNNNEPELPLTVTAKSSPNFSTTSAHPLEDIPLGSHDNIGEMHHQQQRENMQMKKNWVKFDDDVNEISSSTSDNDTQNNYDQTDSTMRAATTFNKLSTSPTALLPPPRPPPPSQSTHRSAIEREKSQTQLQRESVEISPLNDSPTPAQRSIVSSTIVTNGAAAAVVAPAVLTTESTHVNLNASGRAQQPQHQLHQSQTAAQQEKQQKNTRTASLAGSNNHQQQNQQRPLQAHHTQLPGAQHHSNNSNNGTTIATATNNAMHHKSHHQQHHPHSQQQQQHTIAAATTLPVEASVTATAAAAGPPAMRTIELSTGRIREGFANGDVIVTLLPSNTKWPWITPAKFRPELVPEELMAQGLTLTVEDYVQAMETLVNDYRFTVYNICYKRILVCWILLAFVVLLALLFSGLQGAALFALGVGWLFMNASAIFLCMWVKLRLSRGLEKCLARVNRQLIKHNILLILDDRGRISCHKVNLCFLYFDSTQCVNFLNEFLENTERNGGEEIKAGWESKLDIDLNDIVIQGSTPVRLSRKQAVAQELYLNYLQRWGKDFLRRRLDWTVQEQGVHEMPRHLQSSICPCQYEEEIFRNKIKMHIRRRRCLGIDCMGCWL